MATEAEHIAHANRTQKTIAYLLKDTATHSPWIVAAAFYKALHVIEAAFFNNKQILHTSTHGGRESALKGAKAYSHIYSHYKPLQMTADNARYLTSCDSFDDYLSPQNVESKVLRHYLKRIETSALVFLADPTALVGIDTAFGANPKGTKGA
ncbi:MAG: hypothetical protein RIC55_16460 [Pirellulaceae bacterium]